MVDNLNSACKSPIGKGDKFDTRFSLPPTLFTKTNMSLFLRGRLINNSCLYWPRRGVKMASKPSQINYYNSYLILCEFRVEICGSLVIGLLVKELFMFQFAGKEIQANR